MLMMRGYQNLANKFMIVLQKKHWLCENNMIQNIFENIDIKYEFSKISFIKQQNEIKHVYSKIKMFTQL